MDYSLSLFLIWRCENSRWKTVEYIFLQYQFLTNAESSRISNFRRRIREEIQHAFFDIATSNNSISCILIEKIINNFQITTVGWTTKSNVQSGKKKSPWLS